MPTILHVQGFEIKIFTQDHLPPHVHVTARGCEAILNLNCSHQEVTNRNNFRFKPQELKAIKELVQQHKVALCQAWQEIHDDLG